jgi:hypothetical protein
MGLFTAFRESAYPTGTLDAFPASTSFDIGTARNLAWAAQLAYETDSDSREKFNRILARWGWKLETFLIGTSNPIVPIPIAAGYVARAGDVTVIAFAGTEPENLRQWLLNFSIGADTGTHKGYSEGVGSVWGQLLKKIPTGTAIYITGHSLGGALSVVAANRLCREASELGTNIRGIYTMGMPRTFPEETALSYNESPQDSEPPPGMRTFRLMHGDDIVPHVPPTSAPFDYRHVGSVLSGPIDGRFDMHALHPVQMESADADTLTAIAARLNPLADLGPISIKSFLPPKKLPSLLGGGDTADAPPEFPTENSIVRALARILPPSIRDHLMDGYLRALGADL